MALDDVVKTTITGPRIEEAMYRTLRWIDRCIAGNSLKHVIQIENSIFFSHIQSSELNYAKLIIRNCCPG